MKIKYLSNRRIGSRNPDFPDPRPMQFPPQREIQPAAIMPELNGFLRAGETFQSSTGSRNRQSEKNLVAITQN